MSDEINMSNLSTKKLLKIDNSSTKKYFGTIIKS